MMLWINWQQQKKIFNYFFFSSKQNNNSLHLFFKRKKRKLYSSSKSYKMKLTFVIFLPQVSTDNIEIKKPNRISLHYWRIWIFELHSVFFSFIWHKHSSKDFFSMSVGCQGWRWLYRQENNQCWYLTQCFSLIILHLLQTSSFSFICSSVSNIKVFCWILH